MNIADYFSGLERGLTRNVRTGSPEQPILCLAYDNAPHHHEILTFPHHKHIGPQDKLAESPEPTLSEILAEIEKLLGSSQ